MCGRNILPPFPGSNSKPSKKPVSLALWSGTFLQNNRLSLSYMPLQPRTSHSSDLLLPAHVAYSCGMLPFHHQPTGIVVPVLN
jgi:hypothetical protein